jgi:uncharacterized protein DUF3857
VALRRSISIAAMLFLGAAAYRPVSMSAGDEWLPISPEELKMTSVPEAPGAPAIYLYRQVDRNDQESHEYSYLRIKILTEEGRKNADVEIPFFKESGDIRGIKARTIRPDGSVANFDGKVYEKTIVKVRGLKYLAKTFTLPDVQVGSIIEYHYMTTWDPSIYFRESVWILSDDLFTRNAKFSLKSVSGFSIRWSWPIGLPTGTAPPKDDKGTIRLETRNVPAFQEEDFMPPPNELKYRVEFIYTQENDEKEPEKFWKKEGKKLNDQVERFVEKRKAMEQAVAQIVSPNDTPEVKLQKIYARVQQLRNLTYETEKTEQEEKRAKQKDTNSVEDVWKHGYADGREIDWLFLGLARAAGFEAYAVLVSRRSEYFFNSNLMNPNRLNDNVVLVKLNGKDVYYDPGTAFTPFGLLPWSETATKGLRLDKDGGSWVTTSLPESSVSTIERKAVLKLQDDGTLEGKLTVVFAGLEALYLRLDERDEDAAGRKKYLEDLVKEYVPTGIEVELKNTPDWGSSADKLVAEYELKLPGWVSGAGRHVLMAVGIFGAQEKHMYEHATRVHPLYFHYPMQKMDDITIELPLGWQVSSVPKPANDDAKAMLYTMKVENNNGTLHVERCMKSEVIGMDQKYYPALRKFYDVVRTADEQQIVLQPASAAASN